MSKSSIIIDQRELPARITTSPGEMLRAEFLEPLRMSANALALALRVPANRITAIINGDRAVTADTAMRLARYFGTSPRFWLNLQQAHELSRAWAENSATIEREVNPREISEAA